jgi:glutaredoxin-related protein
VKKLITLYSTHCPRCRVLETKLTQKNIEFNVVTDINKMESLGIQSVPILEVDDKLLNFTDAVAWVNKQ